MDRQLCVDDIKQRIFFIRERHVVLDEDVASFFEIPTKRLNEQVKRNQSRFPEHFVFQATVQEFTALQKNTNFAGKHGGRRHLPHLFTEYGTIMLACVLNTDRAIQASSSVVQAFVQSRESHVTYHHLQARLDHLETTTQMILKNVVAPTRNKLSDLPESCDAKEILKAVACYFKIDSHDLLRFTRVSSIVFSRQIAMYLCRELTEMSFKEIGDFFGGRDHTTVMHAYKNIGLRIQKEGAIGQIIFSLRASISK